MKTMEIESGLVAICDDTTIYITASGKNGVVSCPDYKFSKFALRILPFLYRSKTMVKLLQDRFSAEKISFTFELGERIIFRIGYSSRPGLLSRILGIYPIELQTRQLFLLVLDSVRRAKN